MIYGVEAYGNRRDALMMKVTPPILEKLIRGVGWEDPEIAPLMPQILPLRDIADPLREEVRSLYEQGLKLQPQFRPIIQSYFNDPKFPFPGFAKGMDKAEDSTTAEKAQ
jgi:hypothetical protein